jgi:hypothetical protein
MKLPTTNFLNSILVETWCLLFRILPPYPKQKPGLYSIGSPTPESPVLVTGNFVLTVHRLRKALRKTSLWILVADSAGINVWCGAGAGFFSVQKITTAIRLSGLEHTVSHRNIILPQLCANGISRQELEEESGWSCRWGPIRAEDIPAFLTRGETTPDMRRLRFPLRKRLEMSTAAFGFYSLLLLLPLFLLWRRMFLPVTTAFAGLTFVYAVIHPWLPGKDGLAKSLSLTLAAWGGLFLTTHWFLSLSPLRTFHWMIGLAGLSVFTAAELQGMSPLMRGEQSNWIWEGVIAVLLGLTAYLVPLLVGWR